jgi:predicted secreted protein/putative hemolysin
MTSLLRSGRILPGLFILGVLLVLLVLAAGCTQQTATTPGTVPATTPASAAIANPASVYCGQAGGTTEIKTDASGGQYGMCTFANGTSCEEWALMNDKVCKHGAEAAATTAAEGKKMVTLTDTDNGRTEDIAQGTRFAVQLKENPTTGYEWNATVSSGLEIQSSDYQQDKAAEGMVGVGGTRTWVIVANDLGTQKFSAVYKRSWEPVTGNETAYSVNINVVKI